MKKTLFALIATLLITSCGGMSTEDKELLVDGYYRGKTTSMVNIYDDLFHNDTIRYKEGIQSFTIPLEEYKKWTIWEDQFNRGYNITLRFEHIDEVTRVSTGVNNGRTSFLNNGIFIYQEEFSFLDGRIYSITKIAPDDFDPSKWAINLTKLKRWVSENQPELNEFDIMKDDNKGDYAKAIELYNEAMSNPDPN